MTYGFLIFRSIRQANQCGIKMFFPEHFNMPSQGFVGNICTMQASFAGPGRSSAEATFLKPASRCCCRGGGYRTLTLQKTGLWRSFSTKLAPGFFDPLIFS